VNSRTTGEPQVQEWCLDESVESAAPHDGRSACSARRLACGGLSTAQLDRGRWVSAMRQGSSG
jgi:hypothetical protein